MADREKVIDLVQQLIEVCPRYWARLIADHLINNGTLQFPVKIGASIWDIYCLTPREGKVSYIGYDGENFEIYVRFKNGDRDITKLIGMNQLNKKFFLSEEDAYEALNDD